MLNGESRVTWSRTDSIISWVLVNNVCPGIMAKLPSFLCNFRK